MSSGQRLANRRNALFSAGPRSSAGKLRSSSNARSNGVSRKITVPLDDSAFELAVKSVCQESYAPQTAIQNVLALQQHLRVMEAYSELCLDDASGRSVGRIEETEDPTLAAFKDPDTIREYVRVAEDPDDKFALRFLSVLARFDKRAADRKI